MEKGLIVYQRVLNRGLSRAEYGKKLHNEAHLILEKIAARRFGVECFKMSYGKYGKPCFENGSIEFSIAHCEGLVIVAFSSSAVGIDCEKQDRTINKGVAARYMFEGADIFHWTKYEAYGKMTGDGILYSYDKLKDSASFFSHPSIDGYIVTVCTERETEWEIVDYNSGYK